MPYRVPPRDAVYCDRLREPCYEDMDMVSVMSKTLPWQPLCSVKRSDVPEMTHYGIACIVDARGNLLLEQGDIEIPIWTRSTLKPFQLASLLPYIQSQFPQLTDEHWAMMTASHQGDPSQLALLLEACELTNIQQEQLHCPHCYPLSTKNADALKNALKTPRALFHACSGKHIAYLLHQKVTGHLQAYCREDYPAYHLLQQELSARLGHPCASWTTDGCGMPNLGLPPRDLALLYAQLAISTPGDGFLHEVARLMREYPRLVGGAGRLDTCLMQGDQIAYRDEMLSVIAKEGADGLLAMGINRCDAYPDGVGIIIKLASGYNVKLLSLLALEIMRQLGLTQQEQNGLEQSMLSYQFHFGLL